MITEAIHRARDGRTIPLGQSLAPATINLILIDVVNVMKRMVDWGFYSGPVPRLKLPLYPRGTRVGQKNTRSTQRYAKLSPDAKWEALKLIEQTATDHKS